MSAGTETAYRLAKKYKLKTAWGTDILFSSALARRQGDLLVKLAHWYTPAEALAMATGTNGELLALSGKRNPYPGKLGVVEAGALADLLLVDGNPLDEHRAGRRPGQELRRHHEGREDLQEPASQLRVPPAARRTDGRSTASVVVLPRLLDGALATVRQFVVVRPQAFADPAVAGLDVLAKALDVGVAGFPNLRELAAFVARRWRRRLPCARTIVGRVIVTVSTSSRIEVVIMSALLRVRPADAGEGSVYLP